MRASSTFRSPEPAVSCTAHMPNNPNLLPPGPYMLTVLDGGGVPSIAKWVWIS